MNGPVRSAALVAAVSFAAFAFGARYGTAAAAAPVCDRWSARFDEPSVMDDPACLEKLRRDLRGASRESERIFLEAETTIGDDRLAARAWHARDVASARGFWRESLIDSGLAVRGSAGVEPGIRLFVAGNHRASFAWLSCSYDNACPGGGENLDELLSSWHIADELRAGLVLAKQGAYARAETPLRHAAHMMCGFSNDGFCPDPETFVVLGMTEVAAGDRRRGIEHLIEASKRVGLGSPEYPPATSWPAAAAYLLDAIAGPADLPERDERVAR